MVTLLFKKGKLKISFAVSIIAALVVLYIGGMLLFGGGVTMEQLLERQPNPNVKSVRDFSNGDYKIFFAKGGWGPNRDGTIQEIYSINSDGSALKFEKNESTGGDWAKDVMSYGIIESMGQYYGDFASPDGTRKLIIDHKGTAFSSKADIFLEKNGQKEFLLKGVFSELEWLPDSKRIIFSGHDEKLVIFDTDTKQLGYLVDKKDGMFSINMLKAEKNY